MKKSTLYTLLGCASLGAAAGGEYGLYHLGNELKQRVSAVESEFQTVEKEREDLTTKLHNCSTVNECYAVSSRYLSVDQEYRVLKKKYVEAQKVSALDSFGGLLLYCAVILSALGSLASFTSAFSERKDEPFRRISEELKKKALHKMSYGGKRE